jgi:hypothetical protein
MSGATDAEKAVKLRRWRSRANQYRTMAESCKTPNAAEMFRSLAVSCDQMADRIDTHLGLMEASAAAERKFRR